jgi:hypothetical protein
MNANSRPPRSLLVLPVLAVTTGLAILWSGCSPAPAPPGPTPAPPEPASAPPAGTVEGSESEFATPAPEESEPMTPRQVVEGFYSWHIGYTRNTGNPVADGAYRSSEYLSSEFIQRIDGIIASLDNRDGQGYYDPFLCAQDIPGELTVEEPVVSGQEASVLVHEVWNPGTGYELTQDVEVALRLVDGRWKITGVTARMTPEQVVESFYWWYAGYPGNPLADGAYRSSGNLTGEFIQKIDEIVASFDRGGYDPFLCAQDVPEEFTLDEPATVSEDKASLVVHTSFEGHVFTVELRQVDGCGRWQISDVICPEAAPGAEQTTAGWQVFADETYGFQVRFPQSWTYEERSPVPPGFEASDELQVLKRLLVFAPQGWDGPTPPLHIQATEGTEEEFERIYGPATVTENLEINGHPVTRATDDLGEARLIRYTFQSPANERVRIVLVDAISGDPEQARSNKNVTRTIQQILSTFQFTQ